jgi:acyl transferase domain-containing protein/acyl carrier protein
VIKMVKALEHGELPRTLHVDEPSGNVDWTAGAVSLLQQSQPWEASERPRRAGISSFGVSGTNAHLILEEPPRSAAEQRASEPGVGGEQDTPAPAVALVLSGHGAGGLRGQVEQLADLLQDGDLAAGDVGLSLLDRPVLSDRAVVVGKDRAALINGLRDLTRLDPADVLPRAGGVVGELGVLFTGQGSQRVGMGRELYGAYRVFREAFDHACAELDGLLGCSLREVVFDGVDGGLGGLDETSLAQPGLFALEVALFRLIEGWGVKPDHLLGHSIGEIVAAHVSGVLSLGDACKLVAARGRLMGALPAGGAMASIAADEQAVLESLAGFEGRVGIAAINGPCSIAVSGDSDAVQELLQSWVKRGVKIKLLRVSHAFHSHQMDPMLEELAQTLAGLSFSAPTIPIVSNLTGEMAGERELCSVDYWVRHVREPVRFLQGMRTLEQAGVVDYLELGPDAILTAMGQSCLERDGALVGALRNERPEAETLLGALGTLWARGVSVDWAQVLAGHGYKRVVLPKYAFQRKRYWLNTEVDRRDPGSIGLAASGHPLLGAAVSLAGADGWLLTGRISLEGDSWLADYAVMGAVLLPGTGLLELALHAAELAGMHAVEELIIEAPLLLEEQGAYQLQLSVSALDDEGRRRLAIYSCPQPGSEDASTESWVRHASGVLGGDGESGGSLDAPVDPRLEALAEQAWPPQGAEELDTTHFYDRLEEAGYGYGPVFQGLRRAWAVGDEIYAEIALEEEQHGEAADFLIHPALLDAALQAWAFGALEGAGESAPQIPFSYRGVRVYGGGASSLRVCLGSEGVGSEMPTLSLLALDGEGQPLLAVDSLLMRTVDPKLLQAARHMSNEALYELRWQQLPASTSNGDAPTIITLGDDRKDSLSQSGGGSSSEWACYPDLAAVTEVIEGGAPAPQIVLVRASSLASQVDSELSGSVLAQSIHALSERVLALLQDFLAADCLAQSKLVLVTDNALAVAEGEAPGLEQAALVGLLRSAHSEHPGRFSLVDIDRGLASEEALHGALLSEEGELALRLGLLYAPRLGRFEAQEAAAAPEHDPAGTVLLTGGTGGLGGLLALHLAKAHEVRRLLLVSRSGEEAEGAKELMAELEGLGCEVGIVACDASDRKALEDVIARVPAAHPLTAVIHTAAVLDDGMIESLDGERLRRVMAPKVDAAINLHELTSDLPLTELILFSSAAAAVGNPGQANYAAANTFLDALAHHRRAQGLPAISLAFGEWEKATGMTRALSGSDRAHFTRLGTRPLSDEQGLELFDIARSSDRPLLLPVRLDAVALRSLAKAGVLPAVLRGLVRMPARRLAGAGGSLARRLAEAPESEWEAIVLRLVKSHVAGVLEHASLEAIDPHRPFKELGFDSLTAIELRNRLSQTAGLRLSATLTFDHPTPVAVARYLCAKVEGTAPGAQFTRRSRAHLDEPIAIVGMSARYPGGVTCPEELWELVASGHDAISEFPDDRGWDLGRLYDPDPDHSGTSYTRYGGFVHNAGEFDAEHFQISPREALAMDPQQRWMLEGAWEALEDAGIDPLSLQGSETGVFAGVSSSGYGPDFNSLRELVGYVATGSTTSVVSGRVAYALGLEGPAVSVDTACSSSLVTIHLACQALRSGECSLALAGGVTVLSHPGAFIEFSSQRGLSVDGRCRSFGVGAEGTGWSEGMGLVVLERLSDALRSGHRVLGVVRGSAVNQDGASNGLTAPNGPSQERVIRQALANADLSPSDVDVVEAHGTGTALGDPIEAGALLATYGQGRTDGPLYLGSIKSNIGHSQAAAGVAGVIKMVQAMRHGVLPKTLYADQPSPHVDWSEGEIKLLCEPRSWESGSGGAPRRAGVSSFGISGTNAHVILEEAPRLEQSSSVVLADDQSADVSHHLRSGLLPFLVSGSSEGGLVGQAGRLGEYLRGGLGVGLGGVALSLALHRSHLSRRAAVVASDRDGLLVGLDALVRGVSGDGLCVGVARGEGKLAFLFSGQGSQWSGMGGELYGAFPVFAEALDELCVELDGHLERPLREVLFASEGSELALLLGQTGFTQPALFALEVALYRLVTSFGVVPDYLIGHSVGELSAAHVAGVLSLEDACALVAARGRLMGSLPEGGAMLAVQASEQEVLGSLRGVEDRVSLAAINAPEGVVVSGERGAVERLASVWQEQGRRINWLRVSHAFHSQLMDPMLDEFREIVGSLGFAAPVIPIVSNRTGLQLSAGEATSPDYWVDHVRETVRFADGVRFLQGAGVTRFIEIGPDRTLGALTAQCLDGDLAGGVFVAASMRRGEPQARALLGALSEAHVHGVDVDWSAFFDATGAERVELPTYAFQRERYWVNSSAGGGDAVSLGMSAPEHPLLGAAVPLAGEDEGWLFTGVISLESHPWIADHAVLDTVLLPGTGFVELALTAAQRVGAESLEEIVIEAPLLLEQHDTVQIQLSATGPDERGRCRFAIYSRQQPGSEDASSEPWTRHASGVLGGDGTSDVSMDAPVDPRLEALAEQAWPPQGAEELDTTRFYDRLEEAGYGYGPVFQGLRRAWNAGDEIYAEIALQEEQHGEAADFLIHPALLDAALQAWAFGALEGAGESAPQIPFSYRGVRAYGGGAASLRVCLGSEGVGSEMPTLSLLALDGEGQPLLAVDSLLMRTVDQDALQGALRGKGHEALFELQWQEISPPSVSGSGASVATLEGGDGGGGGVRVAGIEESQRYADLAALEDAVVRGAGPPALVLVGASSLAARVDTELAEAIHSLLERTLSLLQAFLVSEALAESKLVLVTDNALAVGEQQETPSLLQAALVGLLRSAHSEHPERFSLIDVDQRSASTDALRGALESDEPELAIRQGLLYMPRLARLEAREPSAVPELDPGGTVLLTGGTGGLGASLALHLARVRGVRHLLLASRSGQEAKGAKELQAELVELGCEVQVVACDVSDREALEGLITQVPAAHPLTAVVHTAGVLEDGAIESLDGERLRRVMRSKVDAAINLHELTADLPLSELILFSSFAGIMGSARQGGYAAANTFLDAFAHYRRAHGLPAVSLAFGAWEKTTGMTGELSEVEYARVLERFRRSEGLLPLSDEQGMELIDVARGVDRPLLVPVRLDAAALRSLARAGMLPAILRGLVRMPARRSGGVEGALAGRLEQAPESEWDAIVLELVKSHVADVLRHASPETIDPQRPFKELGFDSLAAVELRNRLSQATDLKLPATLVFDHPTSSAVAKYIRAAFGGVGRTRTREETAREAIASIPFTRLESSGLLNVLLELASANGDSSEKESNGAGTGGDETGAIHEMDLESLVERALEANTTTPREDSASR